MGERLITAPAREPISLTEAKRQLRVELSDTAEDPLILSLIKTVREYAESETGRALLSQTWELTLDDFRDVIRLPRPPAQSVTSITYYDTNSTLQTLAPANYVLDTSEEPARICLAYGYSWPWVYDRPSGVVVRFVAGYGDNPSEVPESLKAAMLLHLGHLFENREAVITGTISSEIEFSYSSLINRNRVWRP